MTRVAGIDHVHLHVTDVERALGFYQEAFGATEAFRVGARLVFVSLGERGTIALDSRPEAERNPVHVGLALAEREDLDAAVRAAEQAGGKVVERGEHAPGVAYAYVTDPDGNVLEL